MDAGAGTCWTPRVGKTWPGIAVSARAALNAAGFAGDAEVHMNARMLLAPHLAHA